MIGYGNSMFLSTILDTESGVLPVNTVAPVISGSTTLGSVLNSTTGTWTGTPTITYSYQWKRNGANINLATNSSYTLVVADSEANITCQVTATNLIGSANATSNTITAAKYTAPINTVAPIISGTAQENQTVTCSTGTWTGTAPITYAYQWKRNGSNILSATNSSYTIVSADVSQSITCQVTATNGVGSGIAISNTITPIAAVDPDAQAFITAASITNPTQQAAINTLVVDLKGYNIWGKMKALYPIVGGTASSHKFNLKDPRDLDAAFRLTFATGVTHSSTGMIGNGTTGLANTQLQPLGNLLQDSTSYSFYSRTNTNNTTIEMGVSLNDNILEIRTSGITYYRVNGAGLVQHSDANSLGFYTANRTGSLNLSAWKNGVKLASNTSNLSQPTVLGNIFILALNNGVGVGAYYSTKECAFASIGGGLTDTEAANFNTAVQAYQTTLGRQV